MDAKRLFVFLFILVVPNSGNAFRFARSTIVTDDMVETTTTVPLSSKQPHTENFVKVNRSMMIVANEIYNLPRFDPKNTKPNHPESFNNIGSMTNRANVLNESHLLLSSSNVSFVDDQDHCQYCPEPRFIQHYFAKQCIAKELQDECRPKFCPKYFECPKEKELPSDGCMYREKKYQFGQKIPHHDPCQHCLCINSTKGPMMSCAMNECFTSWAPLEPNCYRKYQDGECCPTIECRTNETNVLKCEFEGETFQMGDLFSPRDDPCYNCQCDEKWNNTQASQDWNPLEQCKRIECHLDYDRPENRGCVPVYSERACCPLYFHCPDTPINENEPKCRFGNNWYDIGEKVNVKQHEICLECSCIIPPEITCKHKTCMTPPPMEQRCTPNYTEGECCPSYNCENDSNNVNKIEEENGDLNNSNESIVTNDENNNNNNHCAPLMENCSERCRLVFDEMVARNNDDEHSEPTITKCPRCQCEMEHDSTKLMGRADNSETMDTINQESNKWNKPLDRPNYRAKGHCPDVECEFPCYIYKVATADCPRCGCPVDSSKKGDQQKMETTKVKSFVASKGMVVN
ncbi:hypothetical protein RDWZM_003714 [Blomia tropicalis]|uniref:VWFC domain-containing protein n=1 Tax=Blomia tropicalis TaxID=40697 RepID=A0A9Q0MGN4_BLOTA|nr:hypothetical protein BLOT_002680 [Blomia tropicalis]KAJ6225169.1 hypothetical protein RDWZM_003714 [Blomia tropicalis]